MTASVMTHNQNDSARGLRRLSSPSRSACVGLLDGPQDARTARPAQSRPLSLAHMRDSRLTAQAKMLVVDDTPNTQAAGGSAGAKGYAVETAESGSEALAQIVRHRPDLVLLDVVMPGVSGYEVCRACARIPRPVPCRS